MKNEIKAHHLVETFILNEMSKHPNADKLSIINIPDTEYKYVANTQEWQDTIGKYVAWIPPESLVDVSKPEFAHLASEAKYDENCEKAASGKYYRVRAKKIRGIQSYGIMVKVSEQAKKSFDINQYFDIKHFEAPLASNNRTGLTGGEVASPPKGTYPKYDIESFMKYGRKVFTEGEPVFISEKIHGASSRFLYQDGQQYCGSRNEWKKEFASPPSLTLEELTAKMGDEEKAKLVYEKAVTNFKPKKNMWWTVFQNTPALKNFCENNPGYCIYGEVYGQVQNLKYGAKNNEIWFAAFDIMKPDGTWMDSNDFLETCARYNVNTVPVIHTAFPANFEQLIEMSSGKSLVPGAEHYREGIVVKPVKERYDHKIGRVIAKIISPEYMEKN